VQKIIITLQRFCVFKINKLQLKVTFLVLQLCYVVLQGHDFPSQVAALVQQGSSKYRKYLPSYRHDEAIEPVL
jgi:hypothetical protein